MNTAPLPERPSSLYVETRQCTACNHIGMNDACSQRSVCTACPWCGDTPETDRCPACGAADAMRAACPKCGEPYVVIAESVLGIDWAATTPMSGESTVGCDQTEIGAAADRPTAPPASVPLNGVAATMWHDEGAIARCDFCARYTLDRNTLGACPPTCECGNSLGWSGSFQKPTADAQWSDAAPVRSCDAGCNGCEGCIDDSPLETGEGDAR